MSRYATSDLPQPGIQPGPLHWERGVAFNLNHWSAREVPSIYNIILQVKMWDGNVVNVRPSDAGRIHSSGKLSFQAETDSGSRRPHPTRLRPGFATFRGGRAHSLRETLSSRETSCHGARRFLYQRWVQAVVVILSCSLSHSWEFNTLSAL